MAVTLAAGAGTDDNGLPILGPVADNALLLATLAVALPPVPLVALLIQRRRVPPPRQHAHHDGPLRRSRYVGCELAAEVCQRGLDVVDLAERAVEQLPARRRLRLFRLLKRGQEQLPLVAVVVVDGALGDSTILPADAVRDAASSVYAEIAHRLGWLELDRALSEAEYQQLSANISGWVSQDRTLPEAIETFGPPSLWIGGTNPFYPKTLAYTTADDDHDLICFHLWNAFANEAAETGLRGVHPDPVVLAVRHRPGKFPGSFSFTAEGLNRRPTADQRSPLRSTVWIFHGDRARYASGVFDTLDAGLAWAAVRQVTGILAECAGGGVPTTSQSVKAASRPRRRTTARRTPSPPSVPGYVTST